MADDTPVDTDLIELGDILAEYRNALSASMHDLLIERSKTTQLRRVIAMQREELTAFRERDAAAAVVDKFEPPSSNGDHTEVTDVVRSE